MDEYTVHDAQHVARAEAWRMGQRAFWRGFAFGLILAGAVLTLCAIGLST